LVNRELIEVFSEIAREKNVERSELATILEDLFLYVIEKEYGDSSNCSCIVNLDKGEIEIYAEKTIVNEIDDYKVEITLAEAIEKEPDAADLEVGDVFVEIIDPRVFGRRLVTTVVGYSTTVSIALGDGFDDFTPTFRTNRQYSIGSAVPVRMTLSLD